MSDIISGDVEDKECNKSKKMESSINITVNVSSQTELKKIIESLSVSLTKNKKRKLTRWDYYITIKSKFNRYFFIFKSISLMQHQQQNAEIDRLKNLVIQTETDYEKSKLNGATIFKQLNECKIELSTSTVWRKINFNVFKSLEYLFLVRNIRFKKSFLKITFLILNKVNYECQTE
jgi:hypothetical protein